MQDAMFNSMPGLRPLDASTALLHGHRQMLQQANCFWQRITELVDIIKKILKDFGVCVRTQESLLMLQCGWGVSTLLPLCGC